jgi:hypothetical protein
VTPAAVYRGGDAATQRLALSVRQDSVGYPAETDRLADAYLNTAMGGMEEFNP